MVMRQEAPADVFLRTQPAETGSRLAHIEKCAPRILDVPGVAHCSVQQLSGRHGVNSEHCSH